ncbi:hypothetical protein C8F04DRAFT_1084253 [Mycena alexandri]|uniref:Secreted peptide n=1 Tax=Mycena alexandri TaxID=1745969 RepID=A0AAD6XCH1_9AGAR|nr:hypothetical protein C8F04DRAFT_1084253 [Mycena alexandri]
MSRLVLFLFLFLFLFNSYACAGFVSSRRLPHTCIRAFALRSSLFSILLTSFVFCVLGSFFRFGGAFGRTLSHSRLGCAALALY